MNLSRLFDIDDSRFTGMKDAELLTLIANHDHDALAFVMRNYYSFVYSVLSRHGWNDADAEEMAQDVFVNLSSNAGRIMETQPNWKLGSMLGHMAKKQGSRRAEFNRKKKRDGITISADAPMEDSKGKETRFIFVDSRPLQDSRLLVQEVLESIPADKRSMVERYIFDDVTCSELAREMKTPIPTIFNRVRAVLARTRDTVIHKSLPTERATKLAAPDPALGFVRVPVHNPPASKIKLSESRLKVTQQILEMRKNGMAFKAIAESLGLSVKVVSLRFYYHTDEIGRAKRKDWRQKAYAAAVLADQAIGNVVKARKKPSASVGISSNKQKA